MTSRSIFAPLRDISRNKTLYLMFVPISVYFLLFSYLPMTGIVMAFKEFNFRDGIWMSPWNGVDNFKFFFISGKALQVTINTFVYNVSFLLLYTVFSIAVAIFVAEMKGKFFKKVAQSCMFLPYFISWVVVSAMVYNFFNYDTGTFNHLLVALGAKPINLYSTPRYWYFVLPFLYVWKWVGFGSVLYLAAIMGIDPEIYEAATMDGATVFQRIRSITLPSLRMTMAVLVLLGLGRIMRGEFDMFWQLIGNNGLLIDSTDIIDTLVFRSIMGSQDFAMASAAGLYQSVLCFVIILVANALVKRVDEDYSLF
jgi:ABC-type polysaccharide transport system, permease component